MASNSPVKIDKIDSGDCSTEEEMSSSETVNGDQIFMSSSSSSDRDKSTSPEGVNDLETRPKSKTSSKARRRGCGLCPGCQREDCGRCYNCTRMVKFGGNGKLKKKCMNRKCQYMSKHGSSGGSLIKKFFDLSSASDIPSSLDENLPDPSITPNAVPKEEISATGLKRPLSESSPLMSAKRRCSPAPPTTPPPAPANNETLINQPKTGLLANEWSGIFKSNNKAKSIPQSSDSKSKRLPSSPKRTISSPTRRPSSPRRFPSPKKSSSLLRAHSTSSPRKSSSILFGMYKRDELAPSRDHAPFNDLVHVCQGELSSHIQGTGLINGLQLQNLHVGAGLGHSLDVGMKFSGFNLKQVAKDETSHSTRMSPSITKTGTGISPSVTEAEYVVNSGLQQEELLHQMRTDHPSLDIDWIFKRYCTIKSQLNSLADAQKKKGEQTCEKASGLVCFETKVNRTRNGKKRLSLCCSIRVKKDLKGRIQVNIDGNSGPCSSKPDPMICSIEIDPECTRESPPKVNSIHYQQKGVETRQRRTAFRLAAERLNQGETRRDFQFNKENEMPEGGKRDSDSVRIVSVETPPTKGRKDLPLDDEKPSFQFGHNLWNDFYHPSMSCDIIGNKEGVGKVYSWLSKWKAQCLSSKDSQQERFENETKKNKKTKQDKGRISQEEAVMEKDVDPDFRVPRRRCPRIINMDDSFNSSFGSNEEEEGEDNGMGVALLLCGPVGCGKTAAVYTCAQELGYKVLEINSTHCRTRQNLTSILREATQSHQVSVQQRAIAKGCNQPPPPKQKDTNKGLMAFFKPKPKGPTTAVNKPREKKTDGVVEFNNQVSIATTTLALLEEVDLLCGEESRGFWSGVYDIVQSTKRPLVFTVNDPQLELPFKHTKVVFNQPSTDILSAHCQLLALSHDVHVTNDLANCIVSYAQHDLRKLFNTLHFWVATHPKIHGKTRDMGLARHHFLRDIHLDPLPVAEVDPRATEKHLSLDNHSQMCNRLGLLHTTRENVSEQILPFMINKESTSCASLNEVYKKLDQCVQVCDMLADSDIIMKSHDCYRMSHDLHDPWWSSDITSSLLDELPEDETEQTDGIGCHDYRNWLEATLLLAQRTVAWGSVCNGMEVQDSTLEVIPSPERISEAHDSHMTCCEVFSVHSELDRGSLMAECLPYLHLICKSEKNRESSGLTRRFTHYLSHSEVDVKHLNDFVSKCSYQ